MELLQLQYFFDTAKTENFTRTAEKYIVPTSSVSASVRRLEDELGCKLFDRHANKIVLNENGRLLQRHLCMVFDELSQVRSRLLCTKNDKVELKLLIRSLRQEITNAIIQYRKENLRVYFKTVFNFDENTHYDDYDLVIDNRSDSYPTLESFHLCNKKLRMRVSPDSPLIGRELTMAQLRHQPFVSMDRNSNMHKILMRACNQAGFSPRIVIETNDSLCYSKCILEGMGIGVSRIQSENDTKLGILKVTDFDEELAFYAYHKPLYGQSALSDFVNFLKNYEF